MAKNKKFTVLYRRKRNNKTDYKKRLRLLVSRKPRLVVRKGLRNITAQIIEYSPTGDRIIVSSNTREIKNLGWKGGLSNIPSAYLLGLKIAEKAKEKKIEFAILDKGIHQSIKGSAIYALVKGAVDNGLNVPHSKDIFPSEERISGEHIKNYAEKIKNTEKYAKQFSNYEKNNFNVSNISEEFNKIKSQIMKNG
ncbi:50S ribosomal protein L18 [archaeon]|nr:50S ribosomal protein L18 [archaeon]|tara:strand:+ start:3137 stop:3718 length:582 start_codon:yes stop_codon:yes gene_type:complete